MTKEKAKSLAFRFIRGGIGGAAGAMVAIMGAGINAGGIKTMADLELWYVSLVFAGLTGFVSGIIVAVDKWYRMTP